MCTVLSQPVAWGICPIRTEEILPFINPAKNGPASARGLRLTLHSSLGLYLPTKAPFVEFEFV